MAEHINLTVYRQSAARARSPRNRQTTYAMLAVPVAFALGFLAFRSRRLRPLASACAVLGMAGSATLMLRRREREAREKRIDKTVEASFPASDAPALQP
jgi:hypothetical protein